MGQEAPRVEQSTEIYTTTTKVNRGRILRKNEKLGDGWTKGYHLLGCDWKTN